MAIYNIVDTILNVANEVSKKSIVATSGVVGFRCEVFYPKEPATSDVAQVFGADSQSVVYKSYPDLTKNLIVLGLFGDNFRASDRSFDNSNSEGSPYILTHKDELLPVNSKIKVYRGDEFHLMKVVEHNVYPSIKGQIYYKNLIAPFN